MKKSISLIRNQKGLSLIELIITMVIVVIVLTMNTSTLGVALKQAKQQMTASGAQMDKIAALDILRMDAESAGYGLPWSFQAAINYNEAAAGYNDSPSSAPRALVSGNAAEFNNSDRLVIKSTSVASTPNGTTQKWNYIAWNRATVGSAAFNSNTFVNGERVTVIWANASGGLDKQLIMGGGAMNVTMNDGAGTIPTNFRPVTASQSYVVYGVDPATNLRMPFNRADYYIAQANVPQGCAPGTGVLYKGTVSHADGSLTATPLLDCVADFQVAFGLDTNGDNIVDAYTNDISALGASDIRQQVREVRIYVLSHEGTQDPAFSYTNNNATTIRVGDGALGLGRDFDFSAKIGTKWRNYRWKLDTLIVRPKNIFN